MSAALMQVLPGSFYDVIAQQLADKAAAVHHHDAGDVVSGTFAAARIPSLAISKITGLADILATIPLAQIQADWNQNSSGAASFIKNKPTLFTPVQKAHIADCPADAPTNLNVVTTLLGALVGQVNSTNDKQNQIATKVNLVFDCLEAQGMLAA